MLKKTSRFSVRSIELSVLQSVIVYKCIVHKTVSEFINKYVLSLNNLVSKFSNI